MPYVGPGEARSGHFCAGTIVNGTYPILCRSRLVLPPMDLAADPLAGQIWLRYWQWYEAIDWAEVGIVQVSVDGGAYQSLPSSLVQIQTGVWTQGLCDLSPYAGHTVRVAFYFESNESYQFTGWYLDDISVEEGPVTHRGSPDGFEAGIGCWAVEGGGWEAGTPTVGPVAAYAGERCAGTCLDGDYPYLVDARLISPPLQLARVNQAEPITFDFKHWYDICGDAAGTVELSVDGGAWEVLDTYVGNSGGEWMDGDPIVLTPYVGSSVRLSFRLDSNGTCALPGWYVDEVRFTNVDLGRPAAPSALVVSYTYLDESTTHAALDWEASASPDVAYYAIYRGHSPDFTPDFTNRLALATGTEYLDIDEFSSHYHTKHYKIAAVDVAWNESEIVAPSDLIGVPESRDDVPAPDHAFKLHPNTPNPFNPQTTIAYDLREPCRVCLKIFDVAGRLVAVLADEPRQDAGPHAAVWDGRNQTGHAMPSGTYFYRLEAGGRVETRRMVLVR